VKAEIIGKCTYCSCGIRPKDTNCKTCGEKVHPSTVFYRVESIPDWARAKPVSYLFDLIIAPIAWVYLLVKKFKGRKSKIMNSGVGESDSEP